MSPVAPKRDELTRSIGALKAEGATGLYATVDDAARMMASRFDPARINGVVVLTDGNNDYSAFGSIDPLLANLRHQPPDRAIRVFCIAYGDDAS